MTSILCVSSYFKGNGFIETCHAEGCTTYLLTVEKLLGEPWARDALAEVWALPDFNDSSSVIRAVAWLMKDRSIERIAPLDDFDVELVALLREHFRIPGMGSTTARYFRDKLAMRDRSSTAGIANPRFTRLVNDREIADFTGKVQPPWMLKPRSEASATGIRRIQSSHELWTNLDELGDRRSWFLLEQMIAGDVFHVDTLASEGELVFAQASRYRRPLFEVAHEGGIFASLTMPPEDPLAQRLVDRTRELIEAFRFVRGVMHTEFILGADNELYFLETAARVGGAHITDLVKVATGVDLWAEWARIEVSQGMKKYVSPEAGYVNAALVLSLARQEWPDTSAYDDPEIAQRLLDRKNHVGFILRSESAERVASLLESYVPRIRDDFHASMPAPDRPTA